MEGLIYMGLTEIASGNSVWRGMDYYKEKKVVSWEKTGPETYSDEGAESFKHMGKMLKNK